MRIAANKISTPILLKMCKQDVTKWYIVSDDGKYITDDTQINRIIL